MRAQVTLASIIALSGCAGLQQQYEPEPVVAPSHPSNWSAGEAAEVPPTGDWVQQLGDPVLSSLVDEALSNNPDLMSTFARVQASRAQARSTFGRTLPSVTAGGTTAFSSNVIEVNDNAVRTDNTTFGGNISASWEYDLWGRLQSGVAAAEADLAASEADFAAARLSLAARTAIAVVQLKDAELQEALAEETLQARERTLTLTERRFRNGLSGALDVRLSRSAVESARAGLISRQQRTGEARRAIEVLLGRYPANEIEASESLPTLGVIEGAGDPTSLLSRRPDIAAAEARIVAAGFRVNQARQVLKPSLSLSASLSTNNDDLVDLFDPSYLAQQVAANLAAPLYRGGALKADIEAAEALAQQSAAQYVSTVLSAWQEVENTLAADMFLLEQERSQERALEEARLAERLAERQYQNGLSSIFNLIDAQTRRINAQASLISAQSARVINRIQFHLALGGDLMDSGIGMAEVTDDGEQNL